MSGRATTTPIRVPWAELGIRVPESLQRAFATELSVGDQVSAHSAARIAGVSVIDVLSVMTKLAIRGRCELFQELYYREDCEEPGGRGRGRGRGGRFLCRVSIREPLPAVSTLDEARLAYEVVAVFEVAPL